MVGGKKGDVGDIGIPIVMYVMLVVMALVMSALMAIIFVNVYQKNRRFAFILGVFVVLGIVYQAVTLYNISISLGTTVLVIHLFFAIAAYRKLKGQSSRHAERSG